MQLTEVPMLVDHISSVLASVKNQSNVPLNRSAERRQDVVAPTLYFYAVCKALDDMANAQQILECMKEKRLVLEQTEYVLENSVFLQGLPDGVNLLAKVALGFALLAANEDFARDYSAHISGGEATFLQLKEGLLEVVLKNDLALRPQLRPFQDLLSKVRRRSSR